MDRLLLGLWLEMVLLHIWHRGVHTVVVLRFLLLGLARLVGASSTRRLFLHCRHFEVRWLASCEMLADVITHGVELGG